MTSPAVPTLARSRRVHHRRRSSPFVRWGVRAVAVASGLVALTADAQPAGAPIPDALLTFGFASVVAYASSYARRWTLPVIAGFAALLADGTVQLVVATGTVALAVAALFLGGRQRLLGAVVGALAVQLLLRQPTDSTTYLPSLLAAVAVTATVLSAYENGPGRLRTRAHIAAGLAVIAFIVGSVVLGVAALQARADVREAIQLANDGLDAAQDSRTAEAAQLLNRSAQLFDRANDRLSAPWVLPARALPVIGNNANALVVATEQGHELTSVAARTAAVVDLDDLSFDDGRLDLDAVETIDQPIENAATAAESALAATVDADSPWLLGPVDTRLDELLDELNENAPTLRNVADLVHVTPDLLGADGQRTYLVLFFTPSELRGVGGFVGGFAELRATDGRIELARTGRSLDLNPVLRENGATLSGPDDYLSMWGQYRPERWFQDITFSPDFPTVADVASQLYPQAGGVPVDGVFALDPEALAALTEFTGPIELDGQRFGRENLADHLLNGQYLAFDDENEARRDALDVALEEVFTELLRIDTPSPRAVARTLGPVVDAGRLMMVAGDPTEAAVLDALGLTGALPAPEGRDLLAVTSQNGANNKIDYYLERRIEYQASLRPNGLIDATVRIEMANTAPPGGGDLPLAVVGSNDRGLELGLNRSILTVYTPHDLVGATIDGVAVEARRGTEAGANAYSVNIDVSAGQTRVVEVELIGALGDPSDYQLVVAPQPTVRPDRYVIDVSRPDDPAVRAAIDGNADHLLPDGP